MKKYKKYMYVKIISQFHKFFLFIYLFTNGNNTFIYTWYMYMYVIIYLDCYYLKSVMINLMDSVLPRVYNHDNSVEARTYRRGQVYLHM